MMGSEDVWLTRSSMMKGVKGSEDNDCNLLLNSCTEGTDLTPRLVDGSMKSEADVMDALSFLKICRLVSRVKTGGERRKEERFHVERGA